MASSESLEKPRILDPNADRGVRLITISSVFLILSLAAVLARLASRKIKGARFGLEDALLVIAWVQIPSDH